MRTPPVSRRTAAFLVGPLAAAPLGIFETVRAYSESPAKGWMTGVIYFAVAFVASAFVAITYIGPRYSDPDS